jgi:hypothetical protein
LLGDIFKMMTGYWGRNVFGQANKVYNESQFWEEIGRILHYEV